MTDSEFLEWLYGRLKNVHGENPNFDYMRKLRKIAGGLGRGYVLAYPGCPAEWVVKKEDLD